MSKRNYRKKRRVAPLASVESGLENETFDLNKKNAVNNVESNDKDSNVDSTKGSSTKLIKKNKAKKVSIESETDILSDYESESDPKLIPRKSTKPKKKTS